MVASYWLVVVGSWLLLLLFLPLLKKKKDLLESNFLHEASQRTYAQLTPSIPPNN